MHHAKSLKASRQTTEVVQPGKETFHLPAIRGQVSVIRWRPSRSSLCLLPFRDTMPYASHRQILAKIPCYRSPYPQPGRVDGGAGSLSGYFPQRQGHG